MGSRAERDDPLGAVRRQTAAVLFVDIVGFTTMSETMPPEAVITMIREYHALMTSEIVACDGTIEKYIGDEILPYSACRLRVTAMLRMRCAAPSGCCSHSTA